MAKLELEFGKDGHGIDCLFIKKKKGKINEKEVYEILERRFSGMMYIHIVQIFEETPESYYEDGDVWIMYEPYDILPSIIQWQGGIDCLPNSAIEGYKKVLCGGTENE